jgi:hypothetical protein
MNELKRQNPMEAHRLYGYHFDQQVVSPPGVESSKAVKWHEYRPGLSQSA